MSSTSGFHLKQNPFSVYDFLGLLFPGALALMGLHILMKHVEGEGSEGIKPFLNEFVGTVDCQEIGSINFEYAIKTGVFILMAYILGHLLSFLSSISVEVYLTRLHGYPAKYLLGIKNRCYFDGFKFVCRCFKRLKICLFFKGVCKLIAKAALLVFLLPVVVWDFIVGSLCGANKFYIKKLDWRLRKDLKHKLLDLYGVLELKGDFNSESDFFRLVYHYAVEYAPNHIVYMQNYVALFGLLRTLTFISVIFFWLMLMCLKFDTLTLYYYLSHSLLSYIFFWAYVKFITRFNLEALMAMSVSLDNKVLRIKNSDNDIKIDEHEELNGK